MEFIKKHFQLIVLGLLVVTLGFNTTSSIISAVNPRVANMSQEVIEAIIGDVVDEKIDPIEEKTDRILELVSFDNSYPVIMIATEVSELRTAEAVHARVDFFEDNNWNAQIAAMRYMAQNPDSFIELERRVPNSEVYEAILTRILRY